MCWCVSTKKLIPLRFSSAPELISHSGIVSQRTRSENWIYIIFRVLTPVNDMSPHRMIKYQAVCEILTLNSHYFEFFTQICNNAPQNDLCFVITRFWVTKTKYWDVSANIALVIVYRVPQGSRIQVVIARSSII